MRAALVIAFALASLAFVPIAAADHWPPPGTCVGYWRSVYVCANDPCATVYVAMNPKIGVCYL